MIGLIIACAIFGALICAYWLPGNLELRELKGWLWCQIAGREHRRQVRAILARRGPSDIADAVLAHGVRSSEEIEDAKSAYLKKRGTERPAILPYEPYHHYERKTLLMRMADNEKAVTFQQRVQELEGDWTFAQECELRELMQSRRDGVR